MVHTTHMQIERADYMSTHVAQTKRSAPQFALCSTQTRPTMAATMISMTPLAFAPASLGALRSVRAPLPTSVSARPKWVVPMRCAPCMVAERITDAAVARSKTRRAEIAATIVTGPLFRASHLEVETNGEPERMDEWMELGAYLEELLGPQRCDVRVYQYYLPVFFWVERELVKHQAIMRAATRGSEVRPLIVGFSCPQGGGKTTLTTFLSKLLARRSRTTVIASLDDFYVRHAEQRAIADTHDGNPLLEHRGMPGTHDLDLLLDTLDAVRSFCRAGAECQTQQVRVPRFDKSLHSGRGDRAPEDTWPSIAGSVDVMLLEGWCMGFEAISKDAVLDARLTPVNDALPHYRQVYDRLDSLLVIQIDDMNWVFGWRVEAERQMRAAGKPGLSDDQVKDFVSRFMPAYKHYAPALYCRKTAICPDHELHISIDHSRKPVYLLESEEEV